MSSVLTFNKHEISTLQSCIKIKDNCKGKETLTLNNQNNPIPTKIWKKIELVFASRQGRGESGHQASFHALLRKTFADPKFWQKHFWNSENIIYNILKSQWVKSNELSKTNKQAWTEQPKINHKFYQIQCLSWGRKNL